MSIVRTRQHHHDISRCSSIIIADSPGNSTSSVGLCRLEGPILWLVAARGTAEAEAEAFSLGQLLLAWANFAHLHSSPAINTCEMLPRDAIANQARQVKGSLVLPILFWHPLCINRSILHLKPPCWPDLMPMDDDDDDDDDGTGDNSSDFPRQSNEQLDRFTLDDIASRFRSFEPAVLLCKLLSIYLICRKLGITSWTPCSVCYDALKSPRLLHTLGMVASWPSRKPTNVRIHVPYAVLRRDSQHPTQEVRYVLTYSSPATKDRIPCQLLVLHKKG